MVATRRAELEERLLHLDPDEPGEQDVCTLADFLDDNDGLWPDERCALLTLGVGERTTLGGGAWAETVVERVR